MCFRPANSEFNMECPSCGKTLQVAGNFKLKKCPFCKYDFTVKGDGFTADSFDKMSAAPELPGDSKKGRRGKKK